MTPLTWRCLTCGETGTTDAGAARHTKLGHVTTTEVRA